MKDSEFFGNCEVAKNADQFEESLDRILRLRHSAEQMTQEADKLEKQLCLEVEEMYRKAEQRAAKLKSSLNVTRV